MTTKLTRKERRQYRSDEFFNAKYWSTRLSLNGHMESVWYAVARSKAAARTKISTGNRSGRARIISL
jgi:hypothetical protein